VFMARRRTCTTGIALFLTTLLASHRPALGNDVEGATKAERRGYEHLNNSRFADAIADYDEATRLDVNCGLAYWGRAWAYGLQGKFQEMANDFTEAIRLGIVDADVYYNRGVAFEKLGQHQRASADFATAQRLLQPAKQGYAPAAKFGGQLSEPRSSEGCSRARVSRYFRPTMRCRLRCCVTCCVRR
jgi:tetratricopeptide (TPR) repeat protein